MLTYALSGSEDEEAADGAAGGAARVELLLVLNIVASSYCMLTYVDVC
jgi:hypothetical protein